MSSARHIKQLRLQALFDENEVLATFLDVIDSRKNGVKHMIGLGRSQGQRPPSLLCLTYYKSQSQCGGSTVTVYHVSKPDAAFKIVKSWPLDELKYIDGKDSDPEDLEFILHFSKPNRWTAETISGKRAFLYCLWTLSTKYLRIQPELKNIDFDNLVVGVGGGGADVKSIVAELQRNAEDITGEATIPTLATAAVGSDRYTALTVQEEADIESFLADSDFAMGDAEAFAARLTEELKALDGANIHSFLESENSVISLMGYLDNAIDELDKVEGWLNNYNHQLVHMRKGIAHIETRYMQMQVQDDNNKRLINEVDTLVSQLELKQSTMNTLRSGDLCSADGIDNAVIATGELRAALQLEFSPGLSMMEAVTARISLFQDLRQEFSIRLFKILSEKFVLNLNSDSAGASSASLTTTYSHQKTHSLVSKIRSGGSSIAGSTSASFNASSPGAGADDNAATIRRSKNAINIKAIKAHKDDIISYAPLVHWLAEMNTSTWTQLLSTYTRIANRALRSEMSGFMDYVKHRPLARTVEKQILFSATTAEATTDGVDGSREDARNSFGNANSSNENLSSKARGRAFWCIQFYNLFERVLEEFSELATVEEEFEKVFFDQPGDDRASFVRNTMQATLDGMDSEFISLIEFGVRHDRFNSLVMYLSLNMRIEDVDQSNPSYLNSLFSECQRLVKRHLDTFLCDQYRAVEATKVSKTAKIGLLPYVAKLPSFISAMKGIGSLGQKDNVLSGVVEDALVELTEVIFDAVQQAAHECKLPNVVLCENFHHIHAQLSLLKVMCLERFRKDALLRYRSNLDLYVKGTLGKPLLKLNKFFDGVQRLVESGVKEEEVSFKIAFSKQELRKIIREYPGKEVHKRLESMFKRVAKQMDEDEGLLQVVWRSMQEDFIGQVQLIQTLIQRCYTSTNVVLEFTIDDILSFFSDIAKA